MGFNPSKIEKYTILFLQINLEAIDLGQFKINMI